MSGLRTARWGAGSAVVLLDLGRSRTSRAGSRPPRRPSPPRRRRPRPSSTASRSCTAVPTRTTSAPAGSGSVDVGGDQRHPGAAGGRRAGQGVALPAGGAVAEEADRVEGLPGAAGARPRRGGRPGRARRRPSARASTRRPPRRSRPGSGSRPLPVSAPVSRPTAGSMTTAPRRRSVATLSWVAGCSHISVCMAGAKTTGQRAVSSVLVSRSSARPCAALASRSAVAGATTTRSARLADPDVRHLVDVVPDLGRDRACRTAPPRWARRRTPARRRWARRVTSCPDSVSRRSSSQAL